MREIANEQPEEWFDVLLPDSMYIARPAVLETKVQFHVISWKYESGSFKIRLAVTPSDIDTIDVDATESMDGGSYLNQNYYINIELVLMGGDEQTANNYMENWGFNKNAIVHGP